MGAWSLAAISGIVLAYIALETWRPRLLPPAIAFTAAGLLVGPEGLGWIDVSPEGESLRVLAEATLALVLFSDASRIDLRALRRRLRAAGAAARHRAAADDRGRDGGGARRLPAT